MCVYVCLNHNHSNSIKCILEGLYRQYLSLHLPLSFSLCLYCVVTLLFLIIFCINELFTKYENEREREREIKEEWLLRQCICGDNCEESLSFKFIYLYADVAVLIVVGVGVSGCCIALYLSLSLFTNDAWQTSI